MRALTVLPGTAGSGQLVDWPEPDPQEGSVLVETSVVGVCGTDRELLDGVHGTAPPGEQRLVLGHESVGRVVEAPTGRGLATGDLVVGIVRRPDPEPCTNCAAGEWDMCRNGRYTEHGIRGLHGFARDRYRADPTELVKVDPRLGDLAVLLEPASIVAKAWEHVERIGGRAVWQPTTVLVTGAGPIGLLAALLGVQRGLEVHVLDRVEDGPKPALVTALGATYHATSVADAGLEPDVVIECTGAPAVVRDVLGGTAPNGIVCLTGVSSAGVELPVDLGAVNRELVLNNAVVFGSVNANRHHYDQAARALADADPAWLERLLTRRVPVGDYEQALDLQEDDVKTVMVF